MSAQPPEQEPSIEEILASIRQIISDDDEGVPAPAAAPDPIAPPYPPVDEMDVLELKNPIPAENPVIAMEDSVEEVTETVEDIDFMDEPQIEEEPEKEILAPLPPEEPLSDDGSILNYTARAAALSGFAKLAGNIAINKRRQAEEGLTLEDIVRDMLQPMLRVWLDENLPSMIERLVQKELEKLARNAMDD